MPKKNIDYAKELSKKRDKILNEITTFCQNECGECQCCPEESCVLWRIEQIIDK